VLPPTAQTRNTNFGQPEGGTFAVKYLEVEPDV